MKYAESIEFTDVLAALHACCKNIFTKSVGYAQKSFLFLYHNLKLMSRNYLHIDNKGFTPLGASTFRGAYKHIR